MLRRTSVFGTYLSLAIGAIYSGCKASLSFGEWTFSLKVAFNSARTKGSLPGFRRKRARRGGHLNTRNSRPDHVNTEAPRWQSASRAPPSVPPPIKVAQFRNTSTRPSVTPPPLFSARTETHDVHVQPGTRRKSAPLCHCAALIKTRAALRTSFIVTENFFFFFLVMPFFSGSRRNVENEDTISRRGYRFDRWG